MTEPQALSRDSQSTIGGRLRNVLVLILTLFCVAIGVAFFGFGAVERENTHLATDALPALVETRELVSHVAKLATVTLTHVTNHAESDVFRRGIRAEGAVIDEALAHLREHGIEWEQGSELVSGIVGNLERMAVLHASRTLAIGAQREALRRAREAIDDVVNVVEAQTLAASDDLTRYRTRLDSLFSTNATFEAKRSVETILDEGIASIERLVEMQLALQHLDATIDRLVEIKTPAALERLRARFRLTLRQLTRLTLDVVTADSRAQFGAALRTLSTIGSAKDDPFVLQAQVNEASNEIGEIRTLNQELTGNLDSQAATLFDSVGEQAASARQRAVETIENSRLGLLVIGLVAIAVTVSIGWIYVVRKVAAPLDALTAATYRLAEGDLEVEIPLEGDRDLARLARTMEIFRHNAKLVTRQGAELRERSNEDLQQFAYVSAHDMREPLRTIAMYLGLLKTRVAERLDDTESRHFQYVIDAAVRMDALVRGQLSFSKLTRVPAVRELVDVGEELDFVCQDLRAVIDDKGAEVRWGTLPQITGESAQLRQLLQNLISNSLKFNVSRNPVIEIIGEPKDTHWEFSLTDNGVGVPARDVPKLFNLFYRGYSHEDYSGTGIGLAIARRVVENHGGQIWLDADYSPGARFVFTISREEVIPIENS